MNKKKINSILRKVRFDSGLTQKDARKGVMDEASYSRFENGKREIRFDQIIKILNNLGVSFDDFANIYVNPELSNIRVDFARLIKTLDNDKSVNAIIHIFNELESRYSCLTIVELGVYFDIKTLMHKKYPNQIPPITQKQLAQIVSIFRNSEKKRFLSEDYRILGHTIMNMTKEEMKESIDLIFPVEESIYLSEDEKKYLCSILINTLTPMIMAEEYEFVAYLLKVVKDNDFLYKNTYFFMAQFTYLDNLYEFLKNGNLENMKKIYDIIESIEIIGDPGAAQMMRDETESLFKSKGRRGYSQYDVIAGRN